MSSDPREATALFRYRIVAEATNPRLSPAERGQLVRELANRAYDHPDGSSKTYSRGTLAAGCEPTAITVSMGSCRYPAAISVLYVGIRSYWTKPASCIGSCRAAQPPRSSAILKARHGVVLPDRTIRQHLRRQGLHRAALAGQPRVFGRFEAERPNEPGNRAPGHRGRPWHGETVLNWLQLTAPVSHVINSSRTVFDARGRARLRYRIGARPVRPQ